MIDEVLGTAVTKETCCWLYIPNCSDGDNVQVFAVKEEACC